MLRNQEARPAVIDADQIVLRAHRIGRVAPVQQNHRDAGPIESDHDAVVDGILRGRELQWSKEDPGDLLFNILLTELFGLPLLQRGVAHRMAPQQGVRFGDWRLHYAVADRLEDFSAAEIGNQQPEDMPGGSCRREHMRSRSSAARNQTAQLQLVDCLGDRDPRSVILFSKLRLARQPVPGLKRARLDGGEQIFIHLPILRDLERGACAGRSLHDRYPLLECLASYTTSCGLHAHPPCHGDQLLTLMYRQSVIGVNLARKGYLPVPQVQSKKDGRGGLPEDTGNHAGNSLAAISFTTQYGAQGEIVSDSRR